MIALFVVGIDAMMIGYRISVVCLWGMCLASCAPGPVSPDGGVHPRAGSYYVFANYNTDAGGVRQGPTIDTMFLDIEELSRYGKPVANTTGAGVMALFKNRNMVDTTFIYHEPNGDFSTLSKETGGVWAVYPFATRTSHSWIDVDTTYSDGSTDRISTQRMHIGTREMSIDGQVVVCQVVVDKRVELHSSATGEILRRRALVEEYLYYRPIGYLTQINTADTVWDSGTTTVTRSERILTAYHVW